MKLIKQFCSFDNENQFTIPPRVVEWINNFKTYFDPNLAAQQQKILINDLKNNPSLLDRVESVIDILDEQNKYFQNAIYIDQRIRGLKEILDHVEFLVNTDFGYGKNHIEDVFVEIKDEDFSLDVFTPLDMYQSPNHELWSDQFYEGLKRTEFVVRIQKSGYQTFDIGSVVTEVLDRAMDYFDLRGVKIGIQGLNEEYEDMRATFMGYFIQETRQYVYLGESKFIEFPSQTGRPLNKLPRGNQYFIFIPSEII